MSLTIYNTELGKKVPLETIEPGHVKLYVCGITAYDYCHIGHARSVLVFDMIVRYLRYRDYRVTFVRNFTDIDDKIIKRAAEQNTTSEELSERFIDEYRTDMSVLKILDPDIEPKATEHVPEIISLIEKLIKKGLAYQVGSDVYYRVEQFSDYGKLSGRQLDDMQAGARISVNEEKENPMDFALWKGSKPGEPTWESPWGPGRPGWHIECSAMSQKYLGDEFDIHGGGKDLIFPHHENEIAQSEGTGCGFARNWIHHGFVTIKDEKMSKSLGNFLTIREVLAEHHPEVLRLFVFSTHYRNPLDYSEAALRDSGAALERIYSCLAAIDDLHSGNEGAVSTVTDSDREKLNGLEDRYHEAMDNDFNTAQALGQIFDAVKDLNRIRQQLPSPPPGSDVEFLQGRSAKLKQLCSIMGLATEDPNSFLSSIQQEELNGLTIEAEEIEQLIQERTQARADRNWSRADEIRDLLLDKGIELKDGPEGTTWNTKKP